MDADRLAALLAYCRIENPDGADLMTLEGLYQAAVGYLTNAGIAEPPPDTPRRAQYDLCVNHMVLDAFDQRGAAENAVIHENPAFRRLIAQLKLTEAGAVS